MDLVQKGWWPTDRVQLSTPTQGSKFNSKFSSMISYSRAASLWAEKEPVESFQPLSSSISTVAAELIRWADRFSCWEWTDWYTHGFFISHLKARTLEHNACFLAHFLNSSCNVLSKLPRPSKLSSNWFLLESLPWYVSFQLGLLHYLTSHYYNCAVKTQEDDHFR